MASGLTPKQALFVQEYLVDLNATAAAIRAGYSPKTAKAIACETLTKPYVQEAIQQAMAERVHRTQITQDDVLRELARIAFQDIRSVMSWSGESVTFVDSSELTDDSAALISGVKSRRRITVDKDGASFETVELELKTHDKLAALTQIGKHLGMFTEKVEHAGQIAITEVVVDL